MASINDRSIDAVHRMQDEFKIGENVINMVKNNIKLQLQGVQMYVPVLTGKPGISKTSHINMIAKDLNMVVLYCSLNKPYEWFTGIPNIKSHTNSDKKVISKVEWTMPEIIAKANEMAEDPRYNGCLLYFDDMHVMGPDVQKVFYEFILERQLWNYKIHPRCAFVGAMNSSSQSGYEGMQSAIINRLQIIRVNMDFKYFYDNIGWQLGSCTKTFIKTHTEVLNQPERNDGPFGTYRSVTVLDSLLYSPDGPFAEYKHDNDLNKLLNNIYMYSKGFLSGGAPLAFKNSVAQQIKYDYEGMVNENKYSVDLDDPICQISFANIIPFISNEKQADQFINYTIKLCKDDNNKEKCRNLIVSVMCELLTLRNHYKKLNDEVNVEKKKLIEYIQKNMFDKGGHLLHVYVNDTYNYTFTQINDLDDR